MRMSFGNGKIGHGTKASDSGQAIVEFAISVMVLLTLVFGVIDFGRAIYDVEVMKNLTGEGSSMASRGTSLPDTATAVVAAAAPLDLNDHGRVIVTSVFNNNNSLKITAQASQGGIAALSKIGNVVGGARHASRRGRSSSQPNGLRDRGLLQLHGDHADR